MALRFLVRLALCLSLAAVPAMAQEFKLAMSSPPTSLDPHFYNATPNSNVAAHVFDTLTRLDANDRLLPGLAESWSLVNRLTWEFKLRKGVKFHDGSPLTADDVLWSMERPASIVGSPGGFDAFTRAIVSKKVVDAHTIRFTTREPYPLMLSDMVAVRIVSKKATQGVSSDDFKTGKGMVGTGPYKFVSFLRDDRLELARFDGHWGPRPAWSRVTLRFIPNGATRVAALLAGDVDAIEQVPPPDLDRLGADPAIRMFKKTSHRLIYLMVDAARAHSPFISARDGKPLASNPLQDLRVRQALSMGINRQLIKERVMEGLSEPTGNLVPPSLFGFNPALQVQPYDPQGARTLLAQAGYPDGFSITLHTPNNRYVNDEKITQTIAQMWAKIGIAAKVEGLPNAVYVARASKREYSMALFGYGVQSGESSSLLRNLLACEDSARGYGVLNWTRYCNPGLDKLIVKAMATIDDSARLALLQQATAIGIQDAALIPLHHQVTTWATRKGYAYEARIDERTAAQFFKKQ
ncbi:MAG: ABC transporter substrate-binding protein [Pseudomonadota bacterium]